MELWQLAIGAIVICIIVGGCVSIGIIDVPTEVHTSSETNVLIINNATEPYTMLFNGTNGINGVDGINGTNGIDGINGTNGIDGVDGVDGINGTDGQTGLASITTSVTIANSATETQVIGYTIPANTLNVGSVYRIHAYGIISTKSSTVGATTPRTRIGTTTLTGNILTTETMSTTSSIVNIGFDYTCYVTVKTTGTSGTIYGNSFHGGGAGVGIGYDMNTSSDTVSVNTTVDNVLELTYQWGTANAANTITFTTASLEVVKT